MRRHIKIFIFDDELRIKNFIQDLERRYLIPPESDMKESVGIEIIHRKQLVNAVEELSGLTLAKLKAPGWSSLEIGQHDYDVVLVDYMIAKGTQKEAGLESYLMGFSLGLLVEFYERAPEEPPVFALYTNQPEGAAVIKTLDSRLLVLALQKRYKNVFPHKVFDEADSELFPTFCRCFDTKRKVLLRKLGVNKILGLLQSAQDHSGFNFDQQLDLAGNDQISIRTLFPEEYLKQVTVPLTSLIDKLLKVIVESQFMVRKWFQEALEGITHSLTQVKHEEFHRETQHYERHIEPSFYKRINQEVEEMWKHRGDTSLFLAKRNSILQQIRINIQPSSGIGYTSLIKSQNMDTFVLDNSWENCDYKMIEGIISPDGGIIYSDVAFLKALIGRITQEVDTQGEGLKGKYYKFHSISPDDPLFAYYFMGFVDFCVVQQKSFLADSNEGTRLATGSLASISWKELKSIPYYGQIFFAGVENGRACFIYDMLRKNQIEFHPGNFGYLVECIRKRIRNLERFGVWLVRVPYFQK